MEVIRMKRKALFLVTIIMAVSLSACTNHTASTVDSTGAEVEASSVSTAEKAESSGAVESDRTAESPISSFEPVKEPSAAESAASESPVPTSSEAPRERIAEVSQASAAESPSAKALSRRRRRPNRHNRQTRQLVPNQSPWSVPSRSRRPVNHLRFQSRSRPHPYLM